MTQRLLIPLADYQRIYQIIYSVLETSEVAITHRACIFFATAGALILREHYDLPATISAGCMALMVDEEKANVVLYGRRKNGVFVTDENAFHAWIECDDWLVDFMAPIMSIALREDGQNCEAPRLMLQKRLIDRKTGIGEIQHVGDFFTSHDRALVESLIDSQSDQFSDLLQVCLTWFCKPPKPLKEIAWADSYGPMKILVAHAPSIDGVW